MQVENTLISSPNKLPATSLPAAAIPAEAEDFAEVLADKVASTNAPILEKQKAEKTQMDMMEQRILEVGLSKYIEEQNEVKKLMKALMLMKLRSSGDVEEKVEEFLEEFKANPPMNVDQMFSYMASAFEGIPDDAANDFRRRMEETLSEIRDMMLLSDEELERMKDKALA